MSDTFEATPAMLDRAQGCLLGQLAGDSLGSQVEFSSADYLAWKFPEGVRELQDGGVWTLLAGQPRSESGPTAPAQGLHLAGVGYGGERVLERGRLGLC